MHIFANLYSIFLTYLIIFSLDFGNLIRDKAFPTSVADGAGLECDVSICLSNLDFCSNP